MHQSGLKDSLAAWGWPAFTQANLPNRTNTIHQVPPKRIRSDTFMYPEAAIQRNNNERRSNSHSQLNNNGCISSKRPKNSHFSTPGTSSSIRFQQQRSVLLTPPYHLEEHVGHNFRTPSHAESSFRTTTHIGHSFRNPNQLFSSPVRINTGRQSLGHAYDTQSPRFDKSSNPGANSHRENYYHPSMVTDPWQFSQPVIRS